MPYGIVFMSSVLPTLILTAGGLAAIWIVTHGWLKYKSRPTPEELSRIAESMVDETIEIDGVIEEGKLLTLTAQEAVELNVATAEVADLDTLLEQLNLTTAGMELADRCIKDPALEE